MGWSVKFENHIKGHDSGLSRSSYQSAEKKTQCILFLSPTLRKKMAAFQINNNEQSTASNALVPIEREMFKIVIKPMNKADSHHIEYSNGIGFHASEVFSKIYLKHRTYYAICVINYSNKSGLAEITIDGKNIGNIFCHPHDVTLIQRPIEINRSFLFISQDSVMSAQTGLDILSPMIGNIHVIIRPQDPAFASIAHKPITPRTVENDFSMPACNTFGFSAAGSESSQTKKSTGMTTTATPQDTIDGCVDYNNMKKSYFEDKSLGGTVLSGVTRQNFSPAPFLRTLGEHHFIVNLVVGDPGKNHLFYLDENENSYHSQYPITSL